jgi:two-component system KDP operon response regulator KdpE
MKKYHAGILIVDDEIEIVRLLRYNLVAQGYQVFTASSGEEALTEVTRHRPDLVLLDLNLPDMSGLEVCQQIRESSALPIIVLSVKDRERDKVQALELGADDYVAKPFGIQEVLARIRVALRRLQPSTAGNPERRIQIGPLRVDLEQHRVWLNEQEIMLTPTEYNLLKILLTQRGKVLTRQMLKNMVRGTRAEVSTHSLHVHMAQLRHKIEPAPDQPRFILTIPGVGYRFSDEEETNLKS